MEIWIYSLKQIFLKNWKSQLQGYCGQYYDPILLPYFFTLFLISESFSSIHFHFELHRFVNLDY